MEEHLIHKFSSMNSRMDKAIETVAIGRLCDSIHDAIDIAVAYYDAGGEGPMKGMSPSEMLINIVASSVITVIYNISQDAIPELTDAIAEAIVKGGQHTKDMIDAKSKEQDGQPKH